MTDEDNGKGTEIPWRTVWARCQAVRIGVDVPADNFPDLPKGDWLVKNTHPEAGEGDEPHAFYLDNEAFERDYRENN